VLLEILKYHVVGDVAAGGREVAPRPEVAAPVALAQGGEFLLDAPRGAALDPAHQLADRELWRHRDEHVHVVSREHALDDGHTELGADLVDDLAHPHAQLAAQDGVAVLRLVAQTM
jgi:hypothetical protein